MSPVQPKKPLPHAHFEPLPVAPGPGPSSLVPQAAFSLSSPRFSPGPSAVSALRLPRLVAQVGPRRTLHDSKRAQGPQLMASALGTELPMTSTRRSLPEPARTEQPRDAKTRTSTAGCRKTQIQERPVKVSEVLRLLSSGGAHGMPQVFYLREEQGPVRRPYDLHVVAPSEAGPEHYIFCRAGVLHVTFSGYGGLSSLACWYREAVFWDALHDIPFFRLFRLRKVFCWWRAHVRLSRFLQRCEHLQNLLLTDSALYRAALFGLTRVLEELRASHWLPQSGSYKLMEFSDTLRTQREQFQRNLGDLSQYCRDLLKTVLEESHRSLLQLQHHLRQAQQAKYFCGPMYLHQRHQQELRKELCRAEHIQDRFNAFVRLLNYITVETVLDTIQQDVAHFIHNVVQTQSLVFYTEMTISAQRQLAVDPGLHQFHCVLRELLTAKDLIIQGFDRCGSLGETSLQRPVFSFAFDIDFIKQSCTYNPESTHNGQEFLCCHIVQDQQSPGWEQQQPQLTAQTQILHVNRELLEWTLNMCDVSEPVGAAEHLVQKELDLGWLCDRFSWLLEVHEFVEAWSPALCLTPRGQSAMGGAMKSQSPGFYKEHIVRVHGWLSALRSVPSSVSSTGQMFVISCTGITLKLEQQLKVIDEDLLKHLVEQVRVFSESLISDLERPGVDLLLTDQDFTQYVLKVKQWFSMWPDLKQRLDCTCSLQDVIVSHYREMSAEEHQRSAQVESQWKRFMDLLQEAESAVCQGLPVHTHTLDSLFSFSFCDLTQMVSQHSLEAYMDPGQDASEMSSRLHVLWTHVLTRQARLQQLSSNYNLLQEMPKDLSRLSGEMQKLKARKELWEVLASCAKWVEEWSSVLFIEVDVVRAKRELEGRSQRVRSVSCHLPLDDGVLHRALNELLQQRHQLEALDLLKEPCLKHKHWKAVLRGLGLSHIKVHDLTVGHLLSQRLEQHQSVLGKIITDAKAEHDMECDFQKLQKQWSEKLLTLARFPSSSAEPQGDGRSSREELTWTVTDVEVEVHLAQVHFDLTILSNMLQSAYSDDFKAELENWLQQMHELENILHLFKRFQQMWTFLTKVFKGSSMCIVRTDMLTLFKQVDSKFRQIMDYISGDPHVLLLLGDDLCQFLTSGLSTMDVITSQTVELLESLRSQCSRLRFLSDRELILVFSSPPSPSTMLPMVRKLFIGVQELECRGGDISLESQVTLGVLGRLQEHITFVSPVEPCLNAAEWLSDFDKQLHLSVVERMRECSIVKEQLGPPKQVMSDDGRLVEAKLSIDVTKQIISVAGLLATHPSQCLQVAEEAVWRGVVEDTFPHPVKVNNLKFYLRTRVAVLGRVMRNRAMLEEVSGVTSACLHQFLRTLVQMTMNRSEKLSQLQRVQGPLRSSFEWLSLFKYYLSVQSSQEPLCFVDVLNQRLQYGWEYVGSTDWIIPHTPSTERAKLGILLALTNFRCGLVNGPCKTSKKNLVVQLAMALGRMFFVLECDPSVRRVTVENLLLGSLQTGAWLVLDSADLLSAKVSTTLGQFLIDIQESYSKMTKESKTFIDVVVADKKVPTSYNYGCVMVSSKAQTCNFPEDLQTAFRPVALTHPDYKFIAEVLLTAMGFVDAKYLSQRLVSLITFLKDCLLLPGCKTQNNSCFFLILQNIIASSEPYLEQCRKQRNLTEESGSVFTVVQSLIEEAAVCKSILSALLPWTHELNKTLEFQQLLKETFPVICQFPSLEHYLEEHEKSEVKGAIFEVLQINNLQPDAELLNNALTVYQHLKSGKVVILSGPSGSGKTSCYSVLAEGLNLLANKQRIASRSFVRPFILFPNSMSHEELLGHDCDHKGWQDGALTTFLRNCRDAEGMVNWLVLDGEESRSRAEEQSWMDIIVSLYHSPGLFMCLASGERLIPPREHLRVLLEVSDLSTASPPALTACSLVNFAGTELWRSVWKSELNKILLKHNLDNGVQHLWDTLAEDLFPATLRLLGENCMSPTCRSESGSSRRPPVGLQEIMSFFRILNTLVQHFQVCLDVHDPEDAEEHDSRGVPPCVSYIACSGLENNATMLAKNCFLMAFIWGFGGHLHPSVWPRFHCIAREVLVNSRYQIQVPEGESVFEYFVTSERRVCLQTTALTSHISPKYGVYTHLLNLMLEAKQPVLLVGEPGSGKTTMCRSLPTFKTPCVSLCGSTVLSPSDLFTVFRSVTRPSNLLLFVDDLHEAATDTTGTTSPALEVLRQSVSKGRVVLFSNSSLQHLSTGTVSYMCTSCVPPHTPTLSSRLTRLFSVFTMPALSLDVILSLYSPRLQQWMHPLLPNASEMASCVISATHSLHLALEEYFGHAAADKTDLLFSVHDLQKVFQGMTLWQSDSYMIGPKTIVVSVVKLWLHECTHTFIDRVREEGQRSDLERIMINIGKAHFGSMLEQLKVLEGREKICCPEKDQTMDGVELLRISDLVYSPELPAFLKTEQSRTNSKQITYKEYALDVFAEDLQNILSKELYKDHCGLSNGFLHTYVVHQQRARQLAHIFRVLLIPGAHAVLLASDVGTGRRSTVRCAALLTGSDLLEVHSANEKELSAVLREAGDRSRVRGARVVLLVHADVSAAVRERLLLVMAQGGPGLHSQEQIMKHVVTVTSSGLSQRYYLDQWMFDKFLGQTHKNIHIVMLLPHRSTCHGPEICTLWSTQTRRAVRRSCCVELYLPWSYESLLSTAHRGLQMSAHIGDYVRSAAEAMVRVHLCAGQYASTLLTYQPFSPGSYLEFIGHFCNLFKLLQMKALQHAHRVAAVVSGLEEMTSMALERLLTQREKTRAVQKEEEVLLQAITEQEQWLQDAQHRSDLEEERLTQLEKDIQKTQLKVQAALDAGVRKVTSLDLSALEEVRGYRDPPEPVVMVMDAVCLLFHHRPGWDSIKHLLSRDNFFQELAYFDHCSVSPQQLHELGTLVRSPDFNPELVREASQACESLCRWVLAVYECCRLQKHVEKSRRLEAEAEAARERLHETRRQKEDACGQLKTLRVQLHCVQEQLQKQTSELQQAEQVHREASSTVDKLEMFVCVWKEDTQKAAVALTAVPGDALLTAAAASYLGPFEADTRCELLTKWRGLCETGMICPVPEDPRRPSCSLSGPCSAHLLPVSPLPQRPLAWVLGVSERQLHGVALSSLLRYTLLRSCTQHCLQPCPLLVDPHLCLDSDSTHCCFREELRMTVKDFEVELYADDPDFLDKLERAAVTGARVLVRAAERSPSGPRLLSILSSLLSFSSQPSFSLTLSTNLPVHMLTTEMPGPLLCRLRVVDLSLSTQELENFMQTQLLPPECSPVLIQRQQLEQSQHYLTEWLASREASLMDYIVQCEGPLLDDPGFAEEVCVFHEETGELRRELEQVEGALCGCSEALRSCQPLFTFTTVVYKALQQVAVLSPAYCFSLEQFVSVVKQSVSGRAGALTSHFLVPGAVEELCHQVLSQVLLDYGPCLSQSHEQVLRVLLCVALLRHRQLCSQAEGQAFLQGPLTSDHRHTETWPGSCQENRPETWTQPCHTLPQWIPALKDVLPQLQALELFPPLRGLLWSLSSAPERWQEYLGVPSCVTGPVPFEPYTELSLLLRALLWRTLRPDSLQLIAEDMAESLLGEAPCRWGVQALIRLLRTGPVVLTGARHTQPLQLIKQLALHAQVSLKVLCSWEQAFIISTLKNAPNEGLWLVFKNTHLLEQWDQLWPEIDSRMSHLKGPRRLQLWFIVPEDKIHHIPFVVRLHSLVLVLDSCWSLREEHTTLFPQSQCVSALHRGQCLQRCALFHSVLQQRRTGPDHFYPWTESDLQVLVEAYDDVAALCSDQAGALQYLAVSLVQGARVLDTVHLEEVRSVACTFLLPGADSHHDGPALLELLTGEQKDTGRGRGLCLGFGEDIIEEVLQKKSRSLDVLLRVSQCPQSRSAGDMSTGSPRAPVQHLRALEAYLEARTGPPGVSPRGPLQMFLQGEWDILRAAVSSLVSPSEAELQHIQMRATVLSSYLWHHDGPDPAQAFRLSAFINPKGFLLALRRHYAHNHRKNVSDIILLFQVVGDARLSSRPPEAVYLCGLELRGAAWDPEQGAITDARSAGSPLPLLCVTSSPPVPTSPGNPDPAAPLTYFCPLYVPRLGLSSSERQDTVAMVPLQSRIRPESCALRRVRLVSTQPSLSPV